MPYEFSKVKITNDPSFQDEMYAVTPQLKMQFGDLYQKANDKNNHAIIEELIQMVIKHPYTPQLKNFLSVAYQIRGMMPKAQEVNNWILTEHPNYLFAILNRANELIFNKEYDKVEAIIGSDLTLLALYPDRKIFHTGEFTAYTATAVQYLCAIGRVDEAIDRFNIAKDLDSNSPDVARAEFYINNAIKIFEDIKIEIDSKVPKTRIKKKFEKQRHPTVAKSLPINKFKIPKFNHSEILMLYTYEVDITEKVLKKIMDLPRETLIQDLEAVLADAEYNYYHYQEGDFKYNQTFFLIHATLILGEIKATESLPKLLEIFKNDNDFLEFYYNDFLMEDIWQSLFSISENNKQQLVDFLMLYNISTYGKIVVLNALEQYAYHNIDFLPELNIFFEKIINEFLDTENPESLIDTEFNGFIVASCIDFQFVNLCPKLKELYNRKQVDKLFCGSWKEVKVQFDKPISLSAKRNVQSVYDIYKSVLEQELYDDDEFIGDFERIEKSKPKNTFPNANRNESCPCGSGKKYKKCCL